MICTPEEILCYVGRLGIATPQEIATVNLLLPMATQTVKDFLQYDVEYGLKTEYLPHGNRFEDRDNFVDLSIRGNTVTLVPGTRNNRILQAKHLPVWTQTIGGVSVTGGAGVAGNYQYVADYLGSAYYASVGLTPQMFNWYNTSLGVWVLSGMVGVLSGGYYAAAAGIGNQVSTYSPQNGATGTPAVAVNPPVPLFAAWEDSGALGDQAAGAFSAATLLTLGVDYYVDACEPMDNGLGAGGFGTGALADMSRSGNLIRIGNWAITPRCIKIQYYAGWQPAHFNAPAAGIKKAVLLTIVKAWNQAKLMTKGLPVVGENLGHYAVRYDKDSASMLAGMRLGIPPEAMRDLQPFRHYGRLR